MDNPVNIRFLHINSVSNREYDAILETVRHWASIATGDAEEHVYKRHMLGRWLAAMVLRSYGVTEDQLKGLRISPFGKPYLPGHTLSFSLSHSENIIACAVSDNMKIGIDIEYCRSIDLGEYKDCFSPLEWNNLSSSVTPQRYFLELWTKKESLVKADGRGLQVPLKDVNALGPSGSIHGEEKKWHFYPIEIAGYVCHVCTELPVVRINFS